MIKIVVFLLFLLYPTMHLQIFSISTFGVSSSDIFIIILNCIFAYKFIWEGVELKLPKTSIHLYFISILVFSLISAFIPLFFLNEYHLLQFLKTFAHFLYLYLFAFFSLSFQIDNKLIFKAIQIYLVTALFANIYGIYQLIARALDLPWGWVDLNNISLVSRTDSDATSFKQLALKFKDFYRATSIFSEPSAFVQFNLIALCFLALPFITKTKKIFKSQSFMIVMFILIAINLLITFSLTGVLGLFLLILTSMFLERRELLKLYLKIFTFLAILLVIADYFISDLVGLSVLEMLIDRVLGVFYYFLGIGDLVHGESLSWRLEVVFESFNVWFKNPLTGVGLGLFHANSDIAGFSDNSFLALLAEAGPIAAFSFLFIFISSFYHAVKIRRSTDLILNEYQKTMVNMLPYIIVILFEVNFLTSNGWLGISFIVPLFIALNIINSIYVTNNKYTLVKFRDYPLKNKFYESLANFLKIKSN